MTYESLLEELILEDNWAVHAPYKEELQTLKLNRHLMEQRLGELEEALQLSFTQSLDGFFFMKPDRKARWTPAMSAEEEVEWMLQHHQVGRVNEAMLGMYGASSEEELVGLPASRFFAADPLEARQLLSQLLKAGRMQVNTETYRLDGTPIHIESEHVLLRDGRGRVVGQFGIQRDITATRQLIGRLRESEEWSRALMEQASMPIMVHDADGTAIEVNSAWERMWGARREEVLERYNVLEDPQVEELGLLDPVREAFSGRPAELPPVRFDPAASGQPGRARWLKGRAYPLKDEGGSVRRVVLVNEDVTEEREARLRIQRQDDRYRTLFENSVQSMIIYDVLFEEEGEGVPDARYVDVNASYTAWSGRSREEMVGKTFCQVFGEEQSLAYLEVLAGVARSGKPTTAEFAAPSSDRTIYATVFPIEGSQVGVAFVDITDRKRMEMELRESEAMHRLLTENATDMISRHDPDGSYTYVSPVVEKLLGYQPEEMVGRGAYLFFHPDDMGEVERSHREILEGSDIAYATYRIRHREGHYLWFETTSRTVRDEAGEITSIIAISRDASERIRIQEQLRLSHERYRGIVESQHDMVARVDREGRFTFVNDAFCRLLGVERDKLLGEHWQPTYHPEDRDRIQSLLASLRENPRPLNFEARVLTPEGYRWIHSENYAIRDKEGRVLEVQEVARDISELKRAEQERAEELQAQTALKMAATIAHEFNNPLAVISGAVELIQMEGGESREALERMKVIPRHVQRMKDLVGKLLRLRDVREVDYAAGMKILDIHSGPSLPPDPAPEQPPSEDRGAAC